MNNQFRLYDFPITFDPIQDDMTEEERRTLLITIIEELSNSGAGDVLGSLGGIDNASTKKLSEQAARLIEEHQRRHASNTAKIINDWLSIKYKWQNKLGSGASGGHVESAAAKQVMQSIDDLKHIDPHQSYVSTKRALDDVIRVGKFAGSVGTVINASIALYSGDSNKVMKTIASIFAGILGAMAAGAAATALIGGAIAGSAVAAAVAVAVIAVAASYFSGKAAEWAWDNGLGDLVNDFFDKMGWKDDIEELFA